MAEPAVGVLERERAALGELAGDRLDALTGDARERARGAERDREVGQAADAGVEGGARQLGAVQRAERSTPVGRRPALRVASSSRSIMSRRAATTTTRVRGPSGVSTTPSE